MVHPRDCPRFEYEDQPRHKHHLAERSRAIVVSLRRRSVNVVALAADSRDAHGFLFNELTPLYCAYYAGHYRGEDLRCLREYVVQVPGDPAVGLEPSLVLRTMAALAFQVRAALLALEGWHTDPAVTPHNRLVATVRLACLVFERVLTVHPYANGNGHAARFIIWAILGNFGYWPRTWTIDPRPTDPNYAGLIVAHRHGNPMPLVAAVLEDLVS